MQTPGFINPPIDLILMNRMLSTIATCNLRLFRNNIAVSEQTLATDLVEPDFVGYAPVDLISPSQVINNLVNGGKSFISGDVVFDCTTAPVAAQTIYGWWIASPSGTDVEACGNFTQPFTISKVGDAVPLEVVFNATGGSFTVDAHVLN